MAVVSSYPSCCVCGAIMGHEHHGDCPVPDRRQPVIVIGHQPKLHTAAAEGRMALGDAVRRMPG